MGDFFEKGAEKVFPEFDVRSVAEQLGAEKQGRDDGLTDLPPASASSLSLAESEIVSHFANLVSGSKSSARHFLSNFREQILEVDLPGALDVVRACPRQLEAAFATLEQEHREDLRDRTLLEGEALRSLKDFKSERGLTRQAKQRQEIIFQILLFLVFIGLEGGLNAWFFALASDKGLLGGFFTAIVVSIINVTGGFLAGYFAICSLYHKDYMRKALGMLALLVCGLFSISVNLFAGHYRSALEKDPLSAVNVAVSSFKSNWLGIDSVQGWILCAFGLLLAIVFAIKSFYYDDPYPGYGEKFREHRKAKEELMQAQQAFTNMNKQLGEEYHDKVIARMIDAARQAMIPSRITDPRPSPPGPRALPHESARGNFCQEI